jgi:hypothetical protein
LNRPFRVKIGNRQHKLGKNSAWWVINCELRH